MFFGTPWLLPKYWILMKFANSNSPDDDARSDDNIITITGT